MEGKMKAARRTSCLLENPGPGRIRPEGFLVVVVVAATPVEGTMTTSPARPGKGDRSQHGNSPAKNTPRLHKL